jgi:hypothetical protein
VFTYRACSCENMEMGLRNLLRFHFCIQPERKKDRNIGGKKERKRERKKERKRERKKISKIERKKERKKFYLSSSRYDSV